MSVPVALIDTTFSGKNLATAVSVYEYTAAAAVTVRVQVRLAAVAGNGNYTIHLTLNDGDVQTDDAIGPRTTYAAASGETAFWMTSGNVDMLAGDVLNVFVLGQAGDTNEGGTIRILTDDWLQPTTAGRKLDVAATGEAGLDFANINAATGATTLTNITVPTVTTVTSVAGLANNVITAASIATDAGTELAAATWANATRTLTQSAATIAAAVSGANITIQRGDTLSVPLTGLASNTGYTTIDFTVKESKGDDDNAAILRIRLNSPSANDGLLRLNGAALVAPVVATDGLITVNSSTSITIALAARATDDLVPASGLVYDVQICTASGVTTIAEGICDIAADVTRAIA